MCSSANENISFPTGLELPNKSQWQYISTSLKNETWIFFPAPSPHSQARINRSCRQSAHICPPSASLQHGDLRRPGYTPGKGEGKREELAGDSVLWDTGSKAGWTPVQPVWGRKARTQLSFPFLFSIFWAIPSLEDRAMFPARGGSQPGIWKPGRWSWPGSSACVFNMLNLIFDLASLDPGFHSEISEKCSQGTLTVKTLYTLVSSGLRQQPQLSALRSTQQSTETQMPLSPQTCSAPAVCQVLD